MKRFRFETGEMIISETGEHIENGVEYVLASEAIAEIAERQRKIDLIECFIPEGPISPTKHGSEYF
jgi:hypothetical protein